MQMLIGAHVSTAGGLYNAVQRGIDRDCDTIQIFSQSPRMWRPTKHTQEDFDRFKEDLAASPIESVVIHAVYLINCATADDELRAKSLAALTHTLRVGDAIGAHSVVLHPGADKTGDNAAAINRVASVVKEALAESDTCPLHLENTAGAGGTLGRSFGELASLVEASGGGPRMGVCLDSCHLYASGYDIRNADLLTAVLDECDKELGIGLVGTLHLNDSQGGLGTNRDRHANLGDGELGVVGCSAFLSEPRFENLPVLLEVPGENSGGPGLADVAEAKRLRSEGLTKR